MKRLTGLLSIIILAMVLTACGGYEEATRTFEANEGGVETTITYTHKADKVTKQTAENIVSYEAVGIESTDQAKEAFDPISDEFQGIDGVTQSMEYTDTEAIEKLTVDYENVDFDDIEHLPGMNFDGEVKKNGISMEKSAELLESQGYTEVK